MADTISTGEVLTLSDRQQRAAAVDGWAVQSERTIFIGNGPALERYRTAAHNLGIDVFVYTATSQCLDYPAQAMCGLIARDEGLRTQYIETGTIPQDVEDLRASLYKKEQAAYKRDGGILFLSASNDVDGPARLQAATAQREALIMASMQIPAVPLWKRMAQNAIAVFLDV